MHGSPYVYGKYLPVTEDYEVIFSMKEYKSRFLGSNIAVVFGHNEL